MAAVQLLLGLLKAGIEIGGATANDNNEIVSDTTSLANI